MQIIMQLFLLIFKLFKELTINCYQLIIHKYTYLFYIEQVFTQLFLHKNENNIQLPNYQVSNFVMLLK